MEPKQYDPVVDTPLPDVMTTEEAAAFLGKRTQTLCHWRQVGKGPEWKKNQYGWVRYLKSSVEAWAKIPEERKKVNTNPFAVEKLDKARQVAAKRDATGGWVNPPTWPKEYTLDWYDSDRCNFNPDGSLKPGRALFMGRLGMSGSSYAVKDPETGIGMHWDKDLEKYVVGLGPGQYYIRKRPEPGMDPRFVRPLSYNEKWEDDPTLPQNGEPEPE